MTLALALVCGPAPTPTRALAECEHHAPPVLNAPAKDSVAGASAVTTQYTPPDFLSGIKAQPGFRCDPPPAEGGFTCYGKVAGYSKEVAILVPRNYKQTEKAEVVLHLHGFQKPPKPIEKLVGYYNLQNQLNASGRNSIVVMPYSDKPECQDQAEQLGKADQFDAFMNGVTQLTRKAGLTRTSDLGNIALTTHSGGAKAASKLLEQAVGQQAEAAKDPYATASAASHIHEAYAIDSIYSVEQGYAFMNGFDTMKAFNQFARRPENRFWASYTSHTKTDCAPELQKGMCDPKAKQNTGPKSHLPGGNCADPGAPKFTTVGYSASSPISSSDLGGRVGFIDGSSIGHDASVNALWGTMIGSRP